MQVNIRFTGPFRTLAGRPDAAVDLPEGSSLGDLYARLQQMLPTAFTEQVLSGQRIRGRAGAMVLVNRDRGDEHRTLQEGDVIAFVPPMEGG